MKVKDWFLDFGRGAALGTGILPGVSVGTVGIIVNVYDKLLNFCKNIFFILTKLMRHKTD